MAIYILTGRPRHGKTMELARISVKKLKRKERLFSNLKFNLGVGALKNFDESIVGDWKNKEDRNNPEKLIFYWTNLHELEHFEKGNVIMDEAQRYFNTRQWSQLSTETEIKLQQHGKDDLNIYGTTQHYTRIDISLRLLVEVWYDIETIFGSPDNRKIFLGFKIFRISAIEGVEFMEPYMNQKIKPDLNLVVPVKSRIRFFHKKLGMIYDTRAKVGKSLPMPLVHKVRKCEEEGCNKILVTHE